jgi:WS/DGAT C-terminal domain
MFCFLQILMPVDLRSDTLCPEAHPRLGSKVAPVVMSLPSGVEGSIPRLWAARRIMADMKSSAAPAISYLGSAALMKVLPTQWARKVRNLIRFSYKLFSIYESSRVLQSQMHLIWTGFSFSRIKLNNKPFKIILNNLTN